MFEAKAKASSLRGQGQGKFSSRPRPRPRPVLLEAKAKAKASDHDCLKKIKNDISHQNQIVKLTTKRLSKHKLSTKLSLSEAQSVLLTPTSHSHRWLLHLRNISWLRSVFDPGSGA